jgi:hypothetical protein
MKLTTVTNVSVDGVMQGLGGQDEDRRGGCELQVHGSGNLVRWLFENQLVDEITVHLPRGHRPGHAAIPRHRPGYGA